MLRKLMSIEKASDSNRKITKNMTVKTTKNVSHCGTQRPEPSSLPGWSGEAALENVTYDSGPKGWAELDQEKQEDQTERTVMIDLACWKNENNTELTWETLLNILDYSEWHWENSWVVRLHSVLFGQNCTGWRQLQRGSLSLLNNENVVGLSFKAGFIPIRCYTPGT